MNFIVRKKYPALFYVLIIFLILFTAKPVPDFDINFTMPGSWILLLLTIVLAIFKKINIDRNFIWITLVLLAINLISIYKYGQFYPRFMLIYWFSFFYAYIILKLLKEDFFHVFEKVVYIWSVFIVLPLYLYSMINPGGIVTLLNSLPLSFNHNAVYSSRVYTPIFCYMTDTPFRNSGFGWEPGIFSSILSLAILINLINNQFKFNLRFWLMGLVLFTTWSTTGYILFGIILLWMLVNRYLKKSYGVIILPVFILAFFMIVSSDVIFKKFDFSIKQVSKVERLLKDAKKDKESTIHPQRIASFMITLKDIKENPFFGTLGNFEERWYIKKYGKLDNFRVISGIGNFLTIWGLLGVIIFILSINRSLKLMKFEFNLNNGYFLVMIILAISFSYYIFDSALFYIFIFYYQLKTPVPFRNFSNFIRNIKKLN